MTAPDTSANGRKARDARAPTPEAGRACKKAGAQKISERWRQQRSRLPYLFAAVLALGGMAGSFFIFVPHKLDYFVGLRFRTLAVAGRAR